MASLCDITNTMTFDFGLPSPAPTTGYLHDDDSGVRDLVPQLDVDWGAYDCLDLGAMDRVEREWREAVLAGHQKGHVTPYEPFEVYFDNQWQRAIHMNGAKVYVASGKTVETEELPWRNV